MKLVDGSLRLFDGNSCITHGRMIRAEEKEKQI